MNRYGSFGCTLNYPVLHHGTVLAGANIFFKSHFIACLEQRFPKCVPWNLKVPSVIFKSSARCKLILRMVILINNNHKPSLKKCLKY
jgi:hypothetical protein